jgi:hypothetical protein
MRKTYEPLFKQYGVDVAINGHDHSYDRSYPTCVFFLPIIFPPSRLFRRAFLLLPLPLPLSPFSILTFALFPHFVPSTKKNRFDNAVDLTCGTTHLTIGNGGADDLTLGYIDQVLGEDSELDYYTVEYCKKGAS